MDQEGGVDGDALICSLGIISQEPEINEKKDKLVSN